MSILYRWFKFANLLFFFGLCKGMLCLSGGYEFILPYTFSVAMVGLFSCIGGYKNICYYYKSLFYP